MSRSIEEALGYLRQIDREREQLKGVRHRQCRECYRRFDLLDENDADEWASGHDCEPTPNPSTAQCEKCGDQYEDGGWGDDGNCPRHRLS